MERILLHSSIYMPKYFKSIAINQQRRLKDCSISNHFKTDHSIENRDFKHNISEVELISLVNSLAYKPVEPFEIEISKDNGKVILSKQVIRVNYKDNNDVSIVLRGNKIITAWLNKRDDVHLSLDTNKYFRGNLTSNA